MADLLTLPDLHDSIDAKVTTNAPLKENTGARVNELLNDMADTLWNHGTGAEWGEITGTLSDQTDLQSALDGKDAVGAAAAAQAAAIAAASSDATTKANAAAAASQPADSDLTAIAALTTTSYGRAFLELADAAAARTATGAASQATADALKVEVFSGVVKYAANATYTIDTSAAFGYTVDTIIIESDSGTVTAALKIGATAITGISAVSVTTSAATGTATAANVVSVGNRLILVLSSNADARNVKYTIKYTRS